MLDIDIRTNLRELQRGMTLLEVNQIPFATALALTEIAKDVKTEEVSSMDATFDRPTSFTRNSMGVIPAAKAKPYAVVFVRDIAAKYLEPFEFGGRHDLGRKQGLLTPVGQPTNAYGNLSQGTVARLKGRQNVYVGAIETKNGKTIRGIWERTGVTAKGKTRKRAARGSVFTPEHGRLKLLVRFTDPGEVRQQWHYVERARMVVARSYDARFRAAMARALA